MVIISDLIWFLGTFLVVYLFYFFFQILRHKKINKKKVPVELLYLIKKYNLDINKIKYTSIMQRIALVSAFDIAFIGTFVMRFIKNIYLAIILGGVLFIPLIMITYGFIGRYYKKKGLIKNGNKKN